MDYKLYTEKLKAITTELREYTRAVNTRSYNRALEVCRSEAKVSARTAQDIALDRSTSLLISDHLLDEHACDWYDYNRVAADQSLALRMYQDFAGTGWTLNFPFSPINFKF